MSTITKEYIINATIKNNLYPDIIIEYCKEHNKEEDMITKLMIVLLSDSRLMYKCYIIALEYYQEKYNIVIVRNKENIIINAY